MMAPADEYDVRMAWDTQPVGVIMIMSEYRPGSDDWSWAEEFADMISTDPARCADLIRSVRINGFREPESGEEPVLLGDDRRVWSGHHRILAAHLNGLSFIPCAFGTGGR